MSRRKPRRKKDVQTRLLDRVRRNPANGCWEVQGSRADGCRGHARIKVGGVSRMAHRVAYQLFCGDPGRLNVLHECDNYVCVNPAHLKLGTQADNMRDMHARGRAGVRRRLPKETFDQMCAEIDAGAVLIRVAERYGVSYCHVRRTAKKRRIAKANALPVA
jgi:hypothetical protein